MQDQQITSLNTNRWYDYLLQSSNTTSAALDKFIRYFRISGMNHCNSGPGAWMIGQSASKLPFDPQANVLAAIVEWVENGRAPDMIVGAKFDEDVFENGIIFERKHCRYPMRNRLKNKDVDGVDQRTASSADDWECV